MAGTVVVRDRPHGAVVRPRKRLPREAARRAGRVPELDDEAFRLLAQFPARQGDLAGRAARPPLAVAARSAASASDPGRHQRDAVICSTLHAARAGPPSRTLGAAGAAGEAPGSPRRRRRGGTSSSASPTAPPCAASTASRLDELPDFAARYREVAADLARARTYGADRATLSRLERLAPRATTRSTGTSGAPGARSGSCSRATAPRRSSEARGYVALAGLLRSCCRPPPASRCCASGRRSPPSILPERHAPPRGGGCRAARPPAASTSTCDGGSPDDGIGHHHQQRPGRHRLLRGRLFLGVGSLVLLAYNGLAIGGLRRPLRQRRALDYLLEFISATARWSFSPSGSRAPRASCSAGRRWRPDD